ncbi:MAG TPA: NAD-dependent epimerase/dehydratase family protein [Lentisphaerae bacterium]|nr:NAD-dependent epimerase/dehydratase family protein [Lentisphaerota bacterium]
MSDSFKGLSIFVTGGAGFIGSNWIRYLMEETSARVTVYDNFSTGKARYLERWKGNRRLRVITGDVREFGSLRRAMEGHHWVFHFAANSDIARAAGEPAIDFWNGTYLTHNVLEAMREVGAERIFFTSGSGVYGDVEPEPVPEEFPRMIPISTYGASKLASEALISAYCHLFDMRGTVCRFANIVGPHQTHGVAYDFIHRLMKNPERLLIFGDGRQSKPYLHVDDVVAAFALLTMAQKKNYDVFNVGTDDYLTVREIADIVVSKMGLTGVKYEFTGGARGWKADVPVYRLDTTRIRALGWQNRRSSHEAVEAAVEAILAEAREEVME